METETCGFIMSRGRDLDSFLMRCSQCTIDVEIDKWQEFVLHFRNTHGPPSPQEEASGLQIEEVAVDETKINEEVIEFITEGEEQKSQYEPEILRPGSSMSETSLSDNESVETLSESYAPQSAEEAEQETTQEAMNSPTYKVGK